MMRVAIMQPYVFPYLGYYQLLQAADRFVCFDDVNFIKKGWINRNRILLNGEVYTFTIPIRGASQNVTIRDSMIADDASWKDKLLGNLRQAYRKAPHFERIHPAIETMIRSAEGSIADLAEASLRLVIDHLALTTEVHRSSTLALGAEVKAQERIIAVAKHHGATHYINPANGAQLYREERFAEEGMTLRFLRMDPDLRYAQPGPSEFVAGLSMLDALMNVDRDDLRALLTGYTLFSQAELATSVGPSSDPITSA
jgi:WbqC-like protein family